jgi:Uma2 family endonuclease
MATNIYSMAGRQAIPSTYNAKEYSFLHFGTSYPPSRQAASLKIAAALLRHAEETRSGRVFCAPCHVLLSRNIVVQPDILFVRNARRGIVGKSRLYGAPDLIVEIISSPDKTKEYLFRKRIYSHFGVQELWTAYPTRNIVETWIWSEAGFVSTGSYSKSDRLASFILPDLDLPVASIF